MKTTILAVLALFATSAFADIVISTNPHVIVELQPNTAWRQPMPAECRITYNYTTGQVVVEERPKVKAAINLPPMTRPEISEGDKLCAKAWFGNVATFWKGVGNLVTDKPGT